MSQRGRRAGDSTDTIWTVSATGSVSPTLESTSSPPSPQTEPDAEVCPLAENEGREFPVGGGLMRAPAGRVRFGAAVQVLGVAHVRRSVSSCRHERSHRTLE